MIVLLATLVGGLIEGPRLGWTSPAALALFLAAAAALVVLVAVERRRRQPLIDVRFFRSIPFSAAVVTAIVAFGANGAFLFLNALYLQEVRGMTPFEAGLWTLPAAVATMLVSPLSGRLVGSVGTRTPLVLAGLGVGGAGAVLTTIDARTPMWVLVVAFVLFGFGFGMVNAPITNTAVSGMPRAQSGSAAAVASTSRQTGVSLGVALAGTVTGASAVASVGPSFAVATHAMWWIVVGVGCAIVLVAFVSNSAAADRSVAGSHRCSTTEERAGAAHARRSDTPGITIQRRSCHDRGSSRHSWSKEVGCGCDDRHRDGRAARPGDRARRPASARPGVRPVRGHPHRYAWAVVESRPDVEEAVQDTFLTLWQRAVTLELPADTMLPWLLVVCRNHALNTGRKQARRRGVELPEELPAPDDHAEAAERLRWVRDAIAALPETDRRICELCLLDGHSYAEAAEMLGLSVGAVTQRVARSAHDSGRW